MTSSEIKAERENKASQIFPEPGIVVNKRLSRFSDQFRKIPTFVSDYLISKFVDPHNPNNGINKINSIISEHFVESDQKEWIKSKIKENSYWHVLANVKCRYDQQKDEYFSEIGTIGDQSIRVSPFIIAEYGDILLTSGAWGTAQVSFDPFYKRGGKLYPFVLTDFTPFQITKIDLDMFTRRRKQFTNQEWFDLLITSVGFNPANLSNEEKFVCLYRLIPFVESNVNLVELGPPETGKTFNYRSLSSYGFVVSGSKTTVASFFYHKLRKQLGIVGYKDCVMFDEISNANWNNIDEFTNMLKDYMNIGKFGRDTSEFSSECSIVFSGNIDCDRDKKSPKPYYSNLFAPLPDSISQDRAFLDRIHGYIPGWHAAQISERNLSDSYGFMADYLSEIMHRLRNRSYGHIILDRVDFGSTTHRNQTAVLRLASGLIKLLFPDCNLNETAIKFVMQHSCRLRQTVIDQLAKIAPGEFKNSKIEWKLK